MAPAKGRPQAAAWNIGTMGKATGRGERSKQEGAISAMAWMTERAMLVEHALGIAGGAGGVAEHAGLALRALHPGIVAVIAGNQVFELAIVEADIMVDRRPASFSLSTMGWKSLS